MNNEILKGQLSTQKIKLIEKYSLTCSKDLIWEFKHDKYHTVKYFSHKFAKKESVLALVFYINRLCYAKIKYFENNIDKYEPYKYEFLNGFCKCEMYDMEFLRHKPSNSLIDIRSLSKIKDIHEFRDFCLKLENLE
ncbi:hypothetical protein [Terrisporobacter sp.]